MSEPFILVGLYFLTSFIYGISYLIVRPRIDRGKRYSLLFIGNIFLGLTLVSIVPMYINTYANINHIVITTIILFMAISLALHHFSVLRDKQKWTGIIVPKDISVSLIHGAVSHIFFGLSFAIYGLLLVAYLAPLAEKPSESLVLYGTTLSIEAGAIFCIYLGKRMYPRPKNA